MVGSVRQQRLVIHVSDYDEAIRSTGTCSAWPSRRRMPVTATPRP